MIYLDGSALEQFFPGARHFDDWTEWAIPRLNDVVTTQVGLTEMRQAAEILPRNMKRHAFEVMEQVKARIAVVRISDDTVNVSTHAASVLKPFAALQLGAAVSHPDVDAIATYDAGLARAAEIYGLAVVTPGLPRGWHHSQESSRA